MSTRTKAATWFRYYAEARKALVDEGATRATEPRKETGDLQVFFRPIANAADAFEGAVIYPNGGGGWMASAWLSPENFGPSVAATAGLLPFVGDLAVGRTRRT